MSSFSDLPNDERPWPMRHISKMDEFHGVDKYNLRMSDIAYVGQLVTLGEDRIKEILGKDNINYLKEPLSQIMGLERGLFVFEKYEDKRPEIRLGNDDAARESLMKAYDVTLFPNILNVKKTLGELFSGVNNDERLEEMAKDPVFQADMESAVRAYCAREGHDFE